MRPILILAGFFALPLTAHAADYCVGSVAQLKQAFLSAQSDGESSVIKVREGVYVLDEDISYGQPDGREDGTLTVRGGYSGANCLFQTPNPVNTTIAGTAARSLSLTQFLGLRVEHLGFIGLDVNLGGCPPVFLSCTLNVNRVRAQSSRMTIDLAGGSGLLRDSLFTNGRNDLALVVNVNEIVNGLPIGGGPFRMVNVTVVDALTRFGGGDLNEPDSRLVDVRNSSFSRTGAIEIETNRDLSVRFSRYDSLDPDSGAAVLTGNNTSLQPNFNAQFIPNPGSPLIDRGTASVEGGLSRDVYNEPRVVGQSVDIGAAESPVDGSGIYVVDTSAASGTGSFAAAVALANADSAPNTIHFNIPGSCPKRIARTSALVITDALIIDGYTQPGSSPSAGGSFVVPRPCVILDGANGTHDGIVAGAALTTANEGLRIRGLAFEDFNDALDLTEGVGHIVQGNQFGGTIGSSSDPVNRLAGNNNALVMLDSGAAQYALIGGSNDEDANLFVGASGTAISIASNFNSIVGNQIGYDGTGASSGDFNNDLGVLLTGGNNSVIDNRIGNQFADGLRLTGAASRFNRVEGNALGGRATGRVPVNRLRGVSIQSDAHNNRIGPDNRIIGNLIGVRVNASAGGRNQIFANEIDENQQLGVDLGDGGVTPNDNDPQLCDQTLGCPSNGEQNYPVVSQARFITGVTPIGRPLQLTGSLRSLVRATPYRIDLYVGDQCDSSGHGEGARSIDTIDVTITNSGFCTANNCTANFNAFVAAEAVEPNQFITATATTPAGDTSEFSRCARVLARDLIFTDGF
jgi:hypothetical protein